MSDTRKKKQRPKKRGKKRASPSAKRGAGGATRALSLAALDRRLTELETSVSALQVGGADTPAFTTHTKALTTVAGVLGLDVGPADPVEVKFEKLPGSPALVRVEMKGHGDIIPNGADKGSLPNLRAGTWLIIWIHVSGNVGASAKIKVTGAIESQITVTLVDSGQRSEPRNLLVTG